jgi:AcrR family transcriptional regulator
MGKAVINKGVPGRRKQADRTALSDRLLTEAAIQLLVKFGIQGTTLQAVGERAGYSRGLATHRFGSKAGLFGKVLEIASMDWLERVQATVGERVGADALCAATDAAEAFIRERPEEVRAMYLLWFLSIDPSADYKSNIGNVHHAQRRDVARWIRAGLSAGTVQSDVDPTRIAEQYAASMAGIIYQWLANSEMPLAAMFGQLKADLRVRLEQAPKRAGALRRAASEQRQA